MGGDGLEERERRGGIAIGGYSCQLIPCRLIPCRLIPCELIAVSARSSPDRRWILTVALAAVAVGSGLWFQRGVEATPSRPPSERSVVSASVERPPTETAAAIVVHVSGWVVRPGVVSVPAGGRVSEAVASAGGAKPGARLDNINLAQTLVDGQQIVVPGPESEPQGDGGEVAVPGDGSVHLNSATVSDLERLPGVGPVLAERIIAYRELHGPFSAVEDLLDIAGIGEAKLAALRDSVVLP